MGGQKSGKFVNVYSMKIVNEGRRVVKNMRKFVNVNCERPLTVTARMYPPSRYPLLRRKNRMFL